jgi:hypothetical protein
MPAVGFVKPGGGYLSFDEAPDYYDKHTDVPWSAIALIAKLEKDARRFGLGMSPSGADGETTCIRQLAIKKFLDYLISGISSWQALEGTILHHGFEEIAPPRPGWERELLFPDFFVNEGIILDSANWQKDPLSGSLELEMFPGIWMNGKIDLSKHDWTAIADYKTKAWSGWKDRATGKWKIRHYPPDINNRIQINLYRRAVELCTGINPTELIIHRVYRGARDAQQAWKKYRLEVMSNDELEFRIRDHVVRGQDTFQALRQIVIDNPKATKEELQELLIEGIREVPMDGLDKQMLRGTKCTLYCDQQPVCFKIAGMVGFDDKPDDLLQIKR